MPTIDQCKHCKYKVNNSDGGWCYMFEDMMPDCKQFTALLDWIGGDEFEIEDSDFDPYYPDYC